jgi:uncharacterized protein (TIGR02996 family)
MALRKRGKSRFGEGQDPGFLASIVAEPGDDTRRLAYADWLDEHDRPERAEIIRIQCALARLRYDDGDASALQAQEHRLRAQHLPRWRKEMGLSYAGLTRGFVEGFPSSHPHDFLANAEKLFAAHPIHNLALAGGQDMEAGWGAEVAACSYLSRIETLCLPRDRSCDTDLSDFVAVLSSPHLTNLTTLDAGSGHDYGDDVLRELLGTTGRGRKSGVLPSLRKLRRLSLSGMGLTDDGVRAIARSPLAETLTGLDLSQWAGSMHITSAGITALVKSPLWPRLEELNLSWNAFADAESVRILFTSLHRSRIRRLGLRNWDRSARWSGLAEAMAGAPSWGNLEALDLGSARLSNAGLRRLLRSGHLAGLRWLAFDHGLDDKGLRELANCPHIAGLTALWLNNGMLTDRGLRYLAESPFLTGLVYLNVDSTRVRDKGVAEFVRSPNAATLRFLEVPGNLGDEVYEALATSPYTNRLNVVTFGGYVVDGYKATLTDAGVLALTGSTNLPNLTCINLVEEERLTRKGWESLLECERFASVHGHKTAFDERFSKRFPLSRAELAGHTLLRLFPWSYCTYP